MRTCPAPAFSADLRRLLVVIVFLSLSLPLAAKPLLVSSIKPVQLLVAAVGGDAVESRLLLAASVSPHVYQLKPSDRRLLDKADLVIWVGPDMERFLSKPLSLLDADKVLALGSEEEYPSSKDGHSHQGHSQDGHQHTDEDPHRWLDPLQAVAMAALISERLAQLDPVNASLYRRNWQVFSDAMASLDQQLRDQFEALQNPLPYMVLHDAYSHFERRYGLQHSAALSVSPDRKPGARHLLAIRQQLSDEQIGCVFREPQYQPAVLGSILGEYAVTEGLLDPLAASVPVSVQGYRQFMRQFGDQLIVCLVAK